MTPKNDLFIGTTEGHISVTNFKGKQTNFVPLLSLRLEQIYQGGTLPTGATLACSSVSNEQGVIWVGCVYGLLCIYDIKFNRIASMEMQGVEFTACHFSTSKLGYAIFATSTGKLYNLKLNKAFSRIEPSYKREVPLFETNERSYTCRVN